MPSQQREMSHNAEQPSHASRLIPNYVGHSIDPYIHQMSWGELSGPFLAIIVFVRSLKLFLYGLHVIYEWLLSLANFSDVISPYVAFY
jgi:hypothetical protein